MDSRPSLDLAPHLTSTSTSILTSGVTIPPSWRNNRSSSNRRRHSFIKLAHSPPRHRPRPSHLPPPHPVIHAVIHRAASNRATWSVFCMSLCVFILCCMFSFFFVVTVPLVLHVHLPISRSVSLLFGVGHIGERKYDVPPAFQKIKKE